MQGDAQAILGGLGSVQDGWKVSLSRDWDVSREDGGRRVPRC